MTYSSPSEELIMKHPETRVFLSEEGSLTLALPVYCNDTGLILDTKQLESVVGTKMNERVMGFFMPLGYLVFNPHSIEDDNQLALVFFNERILEHVEDLGRLNEW